MSVTRGATKSKKGYMGVAARSVKILILENLKWTVGW
jgi:hypothetical protein